MRKELMLSALGL